MGYGIPAPSAPNRNSAEDKHSATPGIDLVTAHSMHISKVRRELNCNSPDATKGARKKHGQLAREHQPKK